MTFKRFGISALTTLKHSHTFGFNASCANVHYIDSLSSLEAHYQRDIQRPEYILGEGSNTVFLEDFDGDVVLNRIKGIDYKENEDTHLLSVGSGENWHAFVSWTLTNKMYGFENLALIPGTVGAAPIQNIGAYGVEVEKFIDSVEYFDLTDKKLKLIDKVSCQFGYRDSIFKHELFGRCFITAVNFALPKKHIINANYAPLDKLINPSPEDVFNKVIEVRESKLPDPKVQGNAGSFFKNPVISKEKLHSLLATHSKMPYFELGGNEVKVPAAWLIDQLGFKGKEYRGVRCHDKQALVLVNLGNGDGEGLLMLAKEIIHSTKQAFGIHLENEVRLVGRQGLVTL
jgi:UDP-N-acetylmuramate dehydrogenase